MPDAKPDCHIRIAQRRGRTDPIADLYPEKSLTDRAGVKAQPDCCEKVGHLIGAIRPRILELFPKAAVSEADPELEARDARFRCGEDGSEAVRRGVRAAAREP